MKILLKILVTPFALALSLLAVLLVFDTFLLLFGTDKPHERTSIQNFKIQTLKGKFNDGDDRQMPG